jgi:hypothetical protein
MTTAEELWTDVQRIRTERAEQFPEFKDCLLTMLMAKDRLREFGWNDGMYAPRDGTVFEVIEFGSTGVFDCYYEGEWADGYWMVSDGMDLYPSRSVPLMFRLKPN